MVSVDENENEGEGEGEDEGKVVVWTFVAMVAGILHSVIAQ